MRILIGDCGALEVLGLPRGTRVRALGASSARGFRTLRRPVPGLAPEFLHSNFTREQTLLPALGLEGKSRLAKIILGFYYDF